MSFFGACGTAIREHKAIRRLIVVWAMTLVTWVTIRVFTDLSLITTAVVSAMTLITGLLTVPIGFYFRDRTKEDAGK